jgi:maltose O-acetyltransferase
MGNKDDIRIVLAVPSDCIRLTTIAFAAKRHWNYPDEYYDIWRDELTITEDYIDKNFVFVAICDEEIIGFGAIVEVESSFLAGEVFVEEGYWLDHLFIDPCFLYQGIGTKLLDFTRNFCSEKGVSKLLIFTDPHAIAFYEKSEAVFLYDSPTSIPGRKIPVYCLSIRKGIK